MPGFLGGQTGDLIHRLVINDDMEHIAALFCGGQVIQPHGLTGFQVNIGVQNCIGGFNALIGGLQAGFAVLISDDEGPGVFGILSFGFRPVGDVQLAAVQHLADLLGGGHGVGGFDVADQLAEAAVNSLLVRLGGEVAEGVGEGPQTGDGAGFDEADDAVAVDENGGGVALYAKGLGPGGGAGGHGEGQVVLALEQTDGAVRICGVQSDDGHILAELLIGLLHIREFLHAPGAANVPEIQQYQFLFRQNFGEGQLGTVGGGDGEIVHHITGLQGGGQRLSGDQGGGEGDGGGIAVESVAFFGGVALGDAG